jgi:hypothetical protein
MVERRGQRDRNGLGTRADSGGCLSNRQLIDRDAELREGPRVVDIDGQCLRETLCSARAANLGESSQHGVIALGVLPLALQLGRQAACVSSESRIAFLASHGSGALGFRDCLRQPRDVNERLPYRQRVKSVRIGNGLGCHGVAPCSFLHDAEVARSREGPP